jgi:hypothetical protein
MLYTEYGTFTSADLIKANFEEHIKMPVTEFIKKLFTTTEVFNMTSKTGNMIYVPSAVLQKSVIIIEGND